MTSVTKPGKPADFLPDDTALLRAEADKLRLARGLSMEDLGEIVGIAQQNVSRFLKRNGGISRKTANRLAIALGFRDAEQLIAEAKAMRGMQPEKGNVWSARDSAVRVALAFGWTQDVVDAVLARHHGPETSRYEQRWWLEQIALEGVARRPGR